MMALDFRSLGSLKLLQSILRMTQLSSQNPFSSLLRQLNSYSWILNNCIKSHYNPTAVDRCVNTVQVFHSPRFPIWSLSACFVGRIMYTDERRELLDSHCVKSFQVLEVINLVSHTSPDFSRPACEPGEDKAAMWGACLVSSAASLHVSLIFFIVIFR